jgi:hypothetical protein
MQFRTAGVLAGHMIAVRAAIEKSLISAVRRPPLGTAAAALLVPPSA